MPENSLDLGALKSELSHRGVNSRGWRLYLDHGEAMFKPLRHHSWFANLTSSDKMSAAVAWLCVLQACEMDVLPPHALVLSIGEWQLPGNQLSAISPLFLRAAWKATVLAQYNGADTDAFIQAEVIPLAQWFFQSGAYASTGADRLKAGWESLKRLRLSQDDWPPIIQRFESGAFVMVALCNESALKEEGDAMNHCVGTLGDSCRFESLRIFSIQHKKSRLRVATLSIQEVKPGHWEVDQLKGHSNAEVYSCLWEEVDRLLQVVNTASLADPKLRKFLDFVHTLETV